ncbi:MDR family oxidoreductase [Klugiella xanthotipulae]|uniref:Acrylyl-CoA reductase (NADPH) n=1 Tax=Klugiella xanthotipulae TaxID=244735 RepID=A0A543I720_9MICO|nr:MDR family oxidoreductase [Klugiella xanthotipulae]TQM66406.1 acrylyl-CoA reductase (NADPH) [Klugiella xanthotipulae]
MTKPTYRALYVDKTPGSPEDTPETTTRLAELTAAQLSVHGGDVWVAVDYSSLNYKDALALAGSPGVARTLPLVPGIDLVGTVVESEHGSWVAGDRVILNGAGLGETHHGGLAERALVSGEHLVALPEERSARWAAGLGTAGFTAALSVLAVIDHGVAPDDGPVLVTGAAGGVGSVAIALLRHAGYEVVASTGRVTEQAEYLGRLGATTVIDRSELGAPGDRPLQRARWVAVIDSVGSHTLANALAQTRYDGIVTACGLAQGVDLPATVMPFILRAVTLRGINSVDASLRQRQRAWDYLADAFDEEALGQFIVEIELDEVLSRAGAFANGQVRGRIAVRVGPGTA